MLKGKQYGHSTELKIMINGIESKFQLDSTSEGDLYLVLDDSFVVLKISAGGYLERIGMPPGSSALDLDPEGRIRLE